MEQRPQLPFYLLNPPFRRISPTVQGFLGSRLRGFKEELEESMEENRVPRKQQTLSHFLGGGEQFDLNEMFRDMELAQKSLNPSSTLRDDCTLTSCWEQMRISRFSKPILPLGSLEMKGFSLQPSILPLFPREVEQEVDAKFQVERQKRRQERKERKLKDLERKDKKKKKKEGVAAQPSSANVPPVVLEMWEEATPQPLTSAVPTMKTDLKRNIKKATTVARNYAARGRRSYRGRGRGRGRRGGRRIPGYTTRPSPPQPVHMETEEESMEMEAPVQDPAISSAPSSQSLESIAPSSSASSQELIDAAAMVKNFSGLKMTFKLSRPRDGSPDSGSEVHESFAILEPTHEPLKCKIRISKVRKPSVSDEEAGQDSEEEADLLDYY